RVRGHAAGRRLRSACGHTRGRAESGTVFLEVEVEGTEAQLRFYLQDDACGVVGKPDLGFPAVREDPAGLDDRLDHDRVELAGGDRDALAAEDLDRDRVA